MWWTLIFQMMQVDASHKMSEEGLKCHLMEFVQKSYMFFFP